MKKPKLSFNKLSKWKQRVEIAKDVIEQLRLKRFFATTGVYIEPSDDTYYGHPPICNLQMNNLIESGEASCKVCAKGSLFMSHVMKTNHCTFNQAAESDDYRVIKKRLKMFDENQLDLIETAFEQNVIRTENPFLYTEEEGERTSIAKKAVRFSKSNKSDRRLIVIMKNIIRNKGTFKP